MAAARIPEERRPLVSIVMVFLNMDRFIAEAINSVLAQTHQNWELILVDDGSTDNSTAIAREFETRYAPQIQYVEHAHHQNRGCSASRNAGIELSNGEFITFIDADDVWVPTKLAEQVCIMQANPEIGMVGGAVRHWSSWTGGTDFVHPTGHVQERVVFPPEALLSIYPLGAGRPPDVGALIRRELVISVGGFEEEFKDLYEDAAFFVKLYLVAPVFFAKNLWLNYRIHPDSVVVSFKREGRYDNARLYFLRWLRKYLRSRRVDPRINVALRRALLEQTLSSLRALSLVRKLGRTRRALRQLVSS